MESGNDGHGLFGRALVIWFALIGSEFIHGTLRTIFLVPSVGDFRSRQIGVFTGSILILVVAYVLMPWIHATGRRPLVLVGIFWLALTVVFEFSFGHFVFGRSWVDLASDYNLFRGGFLLIGMAVLTFSPVITMRMRRRE